MPHGRASLAPAVAGAVAAVQENAFVLRPDGSLVTQSSSPAIIADLINRLDLHTGMRVLEIGTGSGYSTALLAHLAGTTGHVLSIDITAELVERARHLLLSNGYPNTTVMHGDGIVGAPEHGPFDRIIAWATAPHLPAAWITQLATDGLIVAPIALAPIATSGVGARIRLTDDDTPIVDQLFPVGFVAMHSHEVDQWLVPTHGVDVLRHDSEQHPWWLSAGWLRTPRHYRTGQQLLDDLIANGRKTTGPLQPDESADDFRAWLLATRPDGLTTAALGDPNWHIGITTAKGAALTGMRIATTTIAVGEDDHRRLGALAESWRQAGRPGLTRLEPVLDAFYDGWTLRAHTKPAN